MEYQRVVRSKLQNYIKAPYAFWAIYESLDKDDCHRFALLYLGAEGVATYHALYCANHCAPRVVCIIQPGTSFGGNWTNFTKREEHLAQAIFSQEALPEIIENGGSGGAHFYEKPIIPEYSVLEGAEGSCVAWRRGI